MKDPVHIEVTIRKTGVVTTILRADFDPIKHDRKAKEHEEQPKGDLAAGVFAGCPELTGTKEAELIAAGIATVELLAGATHEDVSKVLGPRGSGKARAWAVEKAKEPAKE